MYKYRKPELEQFKSVWLTPKGHGLLKAQKKVQKKSMAQLVEDLIMKQYDK